VLETCDQLVARIAAWRSKVLMHAWPDAAQAIAARLAADLKPPVASETQD
jgi:hypothetical protein